MATSNGGRGASGKAPQPEPIPIEERGEAIIAPAADADKSLVYDDVGLAAALTISRSFVHKLKSRGALPRPRRIGRRVLWPREEIEAWVRAGMPSRAKWEQIRGGGP